jgi:hypothetical protein
MTKTEIKRQITIFDRSSCSEQEYRKFLADSFDLILQTGQYLAPDEDINDLELAHLIPDVPETVLAAYVGINDAACSKALVTPLLPQHGHNIVFVFDPQIHPGDSDVPSGTIDARKVLPGFEPPNKTWHDDWTYVMIEDPARSFQSLWQETGYIDMIPAKFEDFTVLTDPELSKVCTFISSKAFDHPVNKNRDYLKAARKRGEQMVDQFIIPELIRDEFDGLIPVVLNKGEKMYVATTDFGPCAHGWCNVHPDNKQMAVINENSAVPLDLVISKPRVDPKYAKGLVPPNGSADMTTDWYFRNELIVRKPLLEGAFKG